MSELSGPETSVLNMIRENPFVGQQEMADQLGLSRSAIAAYIVKLTEKGYILGRGYVLPREDRVMVLGGAVIDRKYLARSPLIAGTSNPVEGMRSFGGVARNVAENLALLGASTGFISAVGADESGRDLLRYMRDHGVDVSSVISLAQERTAEYAAVLEPSGDLAFGIADMAIFDRLTPELMENVWSSVTSARLVFADCNLPAETLSALISKSKAGRFELAVDAVSTPKVTRLPQNLDGIDLLFLNLDEASTLLGKTFSRTIDGMREAALKLHGCGAGAVILSCGTDGVVVASQTDECFIPVVKANPVDMTGAGDAMIAGTLFYYLENAELCDAVRKGALIGSMTTESAASVHPELSTHFVEANLHRLDPHLNHGDTIV